MKLIYQNRHIQTFLVVEGAGIFKKKSSFMTGLMLENRHQNLQPYTTERKMPSLLVRRVWVLEKIAILI